MHFRTCLGTHLDVLAIVGMHELDAPNALPLALVAVQSIGPLQSRNAVPAQLVSCERKTRTQKSSRRSRQGPAPMACEAPAGGQGTLTWAPTDTIMRYAGFDNVIRPKSIRLAQNLLHTPDEGQDALMGVAQ